MQPIQKVNRFIAQLFVLLLMLGTASCQRCAKAVSKAEFIITTSFEGRNAVNQHCVKLTLTNATGRDFKRAETRLFTLHYAAPDTASELKYLGSNINNQSLGKLGINKPIKNGAKIELLLDLSRPKNEKKAFRHIALKDKARELGKLAQIMWVALPHLTLKSRNEIGGLAKQATVRNSIKFLEVHISNEGEAITQAQAKQIKICCTNQENKPGTVSLSLEDEDNYIHEKTLWDLLQSVPKAGGNSLFQAGGTSQVQLYFHGFNTDNTNRSLDASTHATNINVELSGEVVCDTLSIYKKGT